jgi:2-keto-3-deoxy-L-rhamnonate aldolase RhmA
MQRADALTFVAALVETGEAIDEADAIAAVPGLDAIQVGTNDLAVSMGLPGEVDHPKVQAAVRKVIEACRRHGKVAAVGGAYRDDALRLYAGLGIRLMLVGNDLALLMGAMRERSAFVAGLDMAGKK